MAAAVVLHPNPRQHSPVEGAQKEEEKEEEVRMEVHRNLWTLLISPHLLESDPKSLTPV
jgi:hypothetical protein